MHTNKALRQDMLCNIVIHRNAIRLNKNQLKVQTSAAPKFQKESQRIQIHNSYFAHCHIC